MYGENGKCDIWKNTGKGETTLPIVRERNVHRETALVVVYPKPRAASCRVLSRKEREQAERCPLRPPPLATPLRRGLPLGLLGIESPRERPERLGRGRVGGGVGGRVGGRGGVGRTLALPPLGNDEENLRC